LARGFIGNSSSSVITAAGIVEVGEASVEEQETPRTSNNGGVARHLKPGLRQDPPPHTSWGRFKKWSGLKGKTLYDLLSVVLVPLMIALFGTAISVAQYFGQLNAEEQRAQDAALQAYLDQMSGLMLDDDEPLRSSLPSSEQRTLARSRTLTVLSRLDPDQKRAVVRFLTEAQLLNKSDSVVRLAGADLRNADLSKANLSGSNTDSFSSPLRVSPASQFTLPTSTESVAGTPPGTDLSAVDLTGADLSGANLRNASLARANLIGTNLSGTNLSGTNLNGANLTNASGVTNEELEQQAKSLEGTILPDGSKHN
jgi:uncharacterized protein YjbI with pentapeptide repeats